MCSFCIRDSSSEGEPRERPAGSVPLPAHAARPALADVPNYTGREGRRRLLYGGAEERCPAEDCRTRRLCERSRQSVPHTARLIPERSNERGGGALSAQHDALRRQVGARLHPRRHLSARTAGLLRGAHSADGGLRGVQHGLHGRQAARSAGRSQ